MSTIPPSDPDREYPNEYTEVERPFLEQLVGMGWQYQTGSLDYPAVTFRSSFRETVLLERLRDAIRRINLNEHGQEWLDDLTIDRAIRQLLQVEGHGLLEQNRHFTERLIKGERVSVANQDENETATSEVRIHFIAWDQVERNDFLAINQFRVDLRGSRHFKIPDLVLFVNGLPLVVVECKSPGITDPMNDAVDQLLHYSDQRKLDYGEQEGIPELFQFNQLLIGTHFYEAKASTLGDDGTYFQEWKDTSPISNADVLRELGKAKGTLKSQELLVAGMLRPAHLLDIVRNFVLFTTEEGRLVKKVARYQQFRAVHKSIDRLQTGRTRRDSGDMDERGGVIWHTQGSGKSLTMVFLVRKLRTVKRLKSFKVVVVTDRAQLEGQLRDTAELTGETVRPTPDEAKAHITPSDRVKRILREDGPDLVFAMIQKHQNRDVEKEILTYEVPVYERVTSDDNATEPPMLGDSAQPTTEDHTETSDKKGLDSEKLKLSMTEEAQAATENTTGIRKKTRTMREVVRANTPVEPLNESENIVLLVDECHRSQAGDFHANLMQALPNAAKIGFTGTPILRSGDRNTISKFGRFLDLYTMTDSWRDKATVEIIYEGRAAEGLVEHTERLDQAFEHRFREYTEKEKSQIRAYYGNEGDVLEAPKLIATKAQDMLIHYVSNILPNGFKAQIVATTRLAAARYQHSLVEAKRELLEAIAQIPASLTAKTDDELQSESDWTRFLVASHRIRHRIEELEIAAVFSHDHKDPESWRQWTDADKRKTHEDLFKLPFDHADPAKRSPLGMLVVKSMLITGFDAPVEQVMYLDRKLDNEELLQAIARVNRKKKGKACGYVVDYAGVKTNLDAALDTIKKMEAEQAEGGAVAPGPTGGLIKIQDELPKLRDRYQRVMDVFRSRGITDLLPIEPCVDLLEDASLRAEFVTKLRGFLTSLGVLFSRPEANPFKRDAKILAFIARVASNVYSDPQLLLVGVESKVKALVDEYIAAQGIDPVIPPTSIMASQFADEVAKLDSEKTRASAMAHAMRWHITTHTPEDPAFYHQLSEKLKEILSKLKEQWEELQKAMEALRQEAQQHEEAEVVEGLDARTEAPFFGLLKEAATKAGISVESGSDPLVRIVALTSGLVQHIQQEIAVVDFWLDDNSRRQLEVAVIRDLRHSRLFPRDAVDALASSIVDLAYRRRRWLAQ